MANHLIIGLGGTGGKVIRELRKRIYEEFRSNDPGQGVFIDYVYIDSSPADLNDKTGWKVLGKSVHLGEAQKVSINGINTGVLQSLSMYPGIKSFVTQQDKKLMDEHMGPLITAGIGGQRRRLGRLLTANNISDKSNPKNINKIIHDAVGRLQNTNTNKENNVTFHICAGLAGGTGSGSIVDVIAQIRKQYPYELNTHAFKIRLFVYIPERNMVYSSHDNGFYQANGYAALQELNAISTGYYNPTDVTGEKDVFTQDVQRLLKNEESFEACYVYSNVNEDGKMLDLSSRLPASVADFMFQTIVVAGIRGGEGKMSRLVGCENDGAGPEQDQAGNKTRSRKFLSFGITRIEYPETEIEEFVVYTYAAQATRQLTYNMWQDGLGYGECSIEEVGTGIVSEIKDVKNRERLMLSNSYLTLAKPIIDTKLSGRWKDFALTWEDRTQQDAGLIQGQYEKKQWLAEFTKLVDDYYTNSFRAHGVKKFYEIQRQETKAYARHIRRHIERLLFDDWAVGSKESKSILEIEKYSQLLRQDCTDRIESFKQQIARLEEELNEQAIVISEVNKEWNGIGWIREALTNASSKIFSSYKTAKCNYYITSTRIEAYHYAIALLQEIVAELRRMTEGIQAVKNEMITILEDAVKQAGAKCQTNSQQEDSVIKKYDVEKVHSMAKQFAANHEYQMSNAAEIRAKMIAGLGEDGERTFANLFAAIDYDTATEIILDVCTKNARAAMEDAAKYDPLMKMVGVNILDKLKVELNTPEKLESFVKQCVSFAHSYVQFNPEERTKDIAGNVPTMQTMIQVALPKAESDSTKLFKEKLLKAFANEQSGFTENDDLSENYKPSQMVVVCANSGFPIRFLENMTTLKEKYDRLLASPDRELNKMVLHTETFDDELPPLFEISRKEIEEKVKKPLLLAFAMGLISEQHNPVTGEHFYAMNIPDELSETNGEDNWVQLSKTFAGCLEELAGDFKKAQMLIDQVKIELQTKARSNEQKAELKKKVGNVVQQIILPTMCESNQFDPVYIEYKNRAIDIFNKELKEL